MIDAGTGLNIGDFALLSCLDWLYGCLCESHNVMGGGVEGVLLLSLEERSL